MTRRIEAGPILVAVGALLLLVSVFLDWYQPNVTAWQAFEVLDLLMVVLGLAAIVAAVGTMVPAAAVIDRRALPPIVAALLVIVASQILDPPPGVSFALEVEGRGDTRRHVSAVDARTDPATTEGPAVRP